MDRNYFESARNQPGQSSSRHGLARCRDGHAIFTRLECTTPLGFVRQTLAATNDGAPQSLWSQRFATTPTALASLDGQSPRGLVACLRKAPRGSHASAAGTRLVGGRTSLPQHRQKYRQQQQQQQQRSSRVDATRTGGTTIGTVGKSILSTLTAGMSTCYRNALVGFSCDSTTTNDDGDNRSYAGHV